jgi:type IX secretion system PorP/SprF family membrane protein
MSTKHWLFLAAAWLASLSQAWAQDPQYTQFYANPLYLNPAFAGATGDARVSANYRLQWPSLDVNYTTYSMSYDHFVSKISSGFGFFVNQDRIRTKNLFTSAQGNANPLINTSLSAFYSYVIPLSEGLFVQAGLQAGVNMRRVADSFVFESDLIGSGFAENIATGTPRNFFDFSSGVLVYSENFWAGLAASHINQPNQTLLLNGGEDVLPMKLSLHAGYKIDLLPRTDRIHTKEASIMPVMMYRMQGKSDQLDLGVYAIFDPLVLGFWYRGLPIKIYDIQGDNSKYWTANSFRSNDALAFIVGFRLPNMSIGYSYDVSISSLAPAATGGAHELSIAYQFAVNHSHSGGRPRYKRFGRIYCPSPWKLYERSK